MRRLPSNWHAALELAVEYGAAVLPLHHPDASKATGCSCRKPQCPKPGKHPRTMHGMEDASSHPEQVAQWGEAFPLANIGLRPDSVGAAVFDVDGPEGEAHARELGVFSVPTAEVATARGVHRYFAVPDRVRLGNVAWPGLDLRHAAGYVLVPPSRHPSGHVYAWRAPLSALAPIPPALLEAALSRGAVAPATRPPRPRALPPLPSRLTGDSLTRLRRYVARVPNVSDGRKTTAYRLAAKALHDFGCSFADARALVLAWNSENTPPLEEALVVAIVENAQAYGARRVA